MSFKNWNIRQSKFIGFRKIIFFCVVFHISCISSQYRNNEPFNFTNILSWKTVKKQKQRLYWKIFKIHNNRLYYLIFYISSFLSAIMLFNSKLSILYFITVFLIFPMTKCYILYIWTLIEIQSFKKVVAWDVVKFYVQPTTQNVTKHQKCLVLFLDWGKNCSAYTYS